jgi:hypothetical protein
MHFEIESLFTGEKLTLVANPDGHVRIFGWLVEPRPCNAIGFADNGARKRRIEGQPAVSLTDFDPVMVLHLLRQRRTC